MPSSHHFQLNEIIDLILLSNPSKLLDVGVGFGKYGFLAREYLELWKEGADYNKWERQIDGIEAFAGYLHPGHTFAYNHIFTGNATEVIPGLNDRYDLILMIDVFEHFTREEGWRLLETCRAKGRNILISVPAEMSEQEEVFGNPYEWHRYHWKRKDFDSISDKFFLDNRRSLICFIGEESGRIGTILRKRKKRETLVRILEFLHIKGLVKTLIGKNH